MSRYLLLLSFGFATFGLVLGIYMGISQNHAQLVAHAHLLLVGFLMSFVYALCHRLWLGDLITRLAKIQMVLHVLSALVLTAGLFMLYGQIFPGHVIGPVLGIASIGVFLAFLMMFWLLLKHPQARQ
ncbi:TonB-dependent receptor [Marinicella meishanensis]|uniref:TonB-dependent receptor n=1 Tax=Marinicella meishanensis TaxID=2873263 RepID=UPI001CBC92E4|nr:TonB-dependent receptor [Marinicella sp. NBU2979]